MRRILLPALVACCLFVCYDGEAQSSYLGRSTSKTIESPAFAHSTMVSSALAKLTHLQKTCRERMSHLARHIRKAPSSPTVLLFLAFCLAYGVVHAAGPGHGKSVVCAYFVAKGGDLRRAAFFGTLLAFFHVGSAVVLVLVISLLFHSSGLLPFNAMAGKLYPVSYFLIMLIGLAMLTRTCLDLWRPDSARSVDRGDAKSDSKAMPALAFAAGIIPCPGAAIILLFTMNLHMLWLGLLGMVALALGMAITTTLVAGLSLGLRDAALSVGSGFVKRLRPAYVGACALGASFIALFGLFMLLGSLSAGTA